MAASKLKLFLDTNKKKNYMKTHLTNAFFNRFLVMLTTSGLHLTSINCDVCHMWLTPHFHCCDAYHMKFAICTKL